MQKKINSGELVTFEGGIALKDLRRVFPNIDLESNTEFDQLTRIRERTLPDPEILMSRLRVATKAHAITKMESARIKKIIENLDVLFQELPRNNGSSQEITKETLVEIKNFLLEEIYKSDIDEDLAPIMAKDELLNIMTGHVKLEPSGKEFFVSGNDSILEAALGAGINLNWGCSNGNCGLCKAKLVSGKTEKVSHHDFPYKEADKNNNTILMCCHTPITNIEINAEELGLSNIPAQEIKCKVKKLNNTDADICELILQTPRSKRLRFLAGQSVNLSIKPSASKEIQRTLPIANCPCDDRNIQFHIRYDDEDEFANYLGQNLKPGDTVTIHGPEGDFVYDEDATGTVLFIATNTGFAPIQGLIEHAIAVDNAASIKLLRIQESSEKPYLNNRCRSWADALDELAYNVVPDIDEAIRTVDELNRSLQPTQIFVAGPKTSLQALKENQSLAAQNTKFLAVSPSGYLEPD